MHAGTPSLKHAVRLLLQGDRKKSCQKAEAFQVELGVVMAAAEAVLGEADMLAVVVACEELPPHCNAPRDSPRRLPENCEVCTAT